MKRKYTIAAAVVLGSITLAATAATGNGSVRGFLKSILFQVAGPSTYSRLKAASKGPDPHAYGMRGFPQGMQGAPKDIVDKYGQYTGSDWPHKIHADADFADELTAEKEELAAHPGPADRDEYGGWASGPKLKATGFFRTEKVDGKWWLVTPSGHVFFSVGVDSVSDVDKTPVDGREFLFTWLPADGDPLASHYMGQSSGRIFDFYGANLQRKFGANYEPTWRALTLQRLNSWGFNTLGAWPDRTFFKGHMPYTVEIWANGDYNRIDIGGQSRNSLTDPYDPRFATAASKDIYEFARYIKGDPYFVGYFIDNELNWTGNDKTNRYDIAIATLAQDESASPAKAAFVDALKKKYSDISSLNAAWGTTLPDWPALEAPYTAPDNLTDGQMTDMADFELDYARTYFRTVRDEIKKLDPEHLYLGCRFDARRTPEVLKACSEYCDALSFNIYRPKIDPAEWGFFNDLTKPVIITEFNSSTYDHGLGYTGLVHTESQADRARLYAEYVRSAAAMPNIVGVHWYKYVDQPVTGAQDGQNGNDGLVDITDTPYRELTDKMREVNASIYALHSGQ